MDRLNLKSAQSLKKAEESPEDSNRMLMSNLRFNGRARRGLRFRILLAVILFMAPPGMACRTTHSELQGIDQRLVRFEKQVDELRQLLKIPGMSAVIVRDQKVIWAKGFGFADLEKQVPATPDTLYHIASLTKTFAATLIMQLVEQGKLDLNEPMSHYSTDFADDSVRIKHLLSHTSQGTPGERYQYSGDSYAHLTEVLEKKTGKSFRELLTRSFLDPLQMSASVPGHDVVDDVSKWSEQMGKDNLDRYGLSLAKLAVPYTLYGESEVLRAGYPPKGISASAGLLSNVLDMAKYDAAIDRHTFLKPETQALAWTPFTSNAGQPLPHGLGWFAENYRGLKLIWHYGHWGTGFSATYLKVPEKNLSLILLANSEALSDPFYRTGGIETNALACTFLRLFMFEDLRNRTLSDPHWTSDSGTFSKELVRLGKESGYAYDCEGVSHAAIMNWRERRRKGVRTAVKLDPKLFDGYAGAYELNERRTFVITREGDRIFIDVPRGNKSEMFAEAESKFFLKLADVQIKFLKGEKGQVSGIEIVANGEKLTAKKVK